MLKNLDFKMWTTLERNIFRLRCQRFRLYSISLEHIRSTGDVSELSNDHDAEIIEQSWNVTSIRSDNKKSLRIAMLGLPNAGKSTLINQLVGRPVCAASSKVHTTNVNSNAVYVDGDTQLVFVDTPGLVTNRDLHKFKLKNAFTTDINAAIRLADIVAVVQNASHPFKATIIDERVLAVLNRLKLGTPSVLILNKVDRVKHKEKLLNIVDILTSEEGWPNFSDIFMVSALKSDGITDFRKYLIDSAKMRDWEYNHNTISDDSQEKIIERVVRAKYMDFLPQELPYSLRIETEHVNVLADGSMSTIVAVTCSTDRISRVVMGKGGGRVKIVALLAEQDLCQVFRTTVRLRIAVKFSKGRRDEVDPEVKKSEQIFNIL